MSRLTLVTELLPHSRFHAAAARANYLSKGKEAAFKTGPALPFYRPRTTPPGTNLPSLTNAYSATPPLPRPWMRLKLFRYLTGLLLDLYSLSGSCAFCLECICFFPLAHRVVLLCDTLEMA